MWQKRSRALFSKDRHFFTVSANLTTFFLARPLLYADYTFNIRIQKADTAFSTEGFCNWKKATVRFKQHELSHAHQVAVEAHISRKRPINQQLVKQLNKTTESTI